MNDPTPPALVALAGKVSPDWLKRGVWLSEAPVVLADGNGAMMLQMMREGAEQFTKLQEGLTPEAFTALSDRPEIERDSELLDKEALLAWRKYRTGLAALRLNILARLGFGQLVAFGDPGRPGSDPEWIPVRSWYHLKPDQTTRNKVAGEAGSFWFVKVVDLAKETLVKPDSSENDAPAISATGLPKAKPGPKGDLTARTAAAMLADLKSGTTTVASLRNEKQEALASRYGVASRSTAMNALKMAVSQFSSQPNSDK